MDNRQQTIRYYVFLSIFLLVVLFLFIGPSKSIGRESPRWFVYWNSEKGNNNSKNWACHNYAHNLMRTAEPNSIFMTEGGDNQVFSLLYFSYVERKRPDIDFFDQKGNVFPRLYGDLMNVHPIDLEVIRDLRDFQLYSTGRPVYLTWRRPNLHRLSADYFPQKIQELKQKYPRFSQYLDNKWKLDTLEQIEYAIENMVPAETFNKRMKVGTNLKKQHLRYLGPWYFKQYGILFKVTPIKYAIVDALEVYRRATPEQIIPFVKRVSEMNLSPKQIVRYTKELIKEGYIAEENKGYYKLVKPLSTPYHNGNLDAYWDNYTMSYTNVFNARYWDYLTREIFDNYNFQRGNYCLNKANHLEEMANYATSEKSKSQYLQNASAYRNESHIWFKQGCFYGLDMPIRFFNYANVLMQLGKQKEALGYYQEAGEMQRDMYLPFLNIGYYYLNLSREVPVVSEKEMLDEAIKNFEEAKFRLELYVNKINQKPNADQNYINLQVALNRAKACLENPRSTLKQKEEQAKSGLEKDLEELANFYAKRIEFDKAIEIYDKLLSKSPNDYSLIVKKYNLAKQFNVILSVQILEDALRRFDKLQRVNPNEQFQLAKICGEFYLNYGENLLNQQNANVSLTQVEQFFLKANEYLSIYRNWGMQLLGYLRTQGEIKKANQLRKDLVQAEKRLKQIDQRLQLLENVKKQQNQT